MTSKPDFIVQFFHKTGKEEEISSTIMLLFQGNNLLKTDFICKFEMPTKVTKKNPFRVSSEMEQANASKNEYNALKMLILKYIYASVVCT